MLALSFFKHLQAKPRIVQATKVTEVTRCRCGGGSSFLTSTNKETDQLESVNAWGDLNTEPPPGPRDYDRFSLTRSNSLARFSPKGYI
ncbi:hypothetical protein TSMEX_010722 [Taenia solium]|eukprot:TsM_000953700 transcript=TsM_000953700 gene=TsM_000953700